MGNSNSQTVQLRPSSGFSLGSSKENRNYKWPSQKNHKYASPTNRVLPPPIVGQRLRHTDNGHILQNGGTISGRRLAILLQRRRDSSDEYDEPEDGADPALINHDHRGSIQKSSSMLYGHKKSHSDPDIIRSMLRKNVDSGRSHPKSVIAVSPSKAKIKSRKKGRAPEPPPQSNTLPRELDRIPLYSRDHLLLSSVVKAINTSTNNFQTTRTKSPAPLPPGGGQQCQQQQRHFAKNKMSKSTTDLTCSSTNETTAMERREPHRKSLGNLETGEHGRTAAVGHKKYAPNKQEQKVLKEPQKFQSFQEEIMLAVKKKSQNWAFFAMDKKKGENNDHGRRSPVYNDLCNSDALKKAWSEEVRKAEDDQIDVWRIKQETDYHNENYDDDDDDVPDGLIIDKLTPKNNNNEKFKLKSIKTFDEDSGNDNLNKKNIKTSPRNRFRSNNQIQSIKQERIKLESSAYNFDEPEELEPVWLNETMNHNKNEISNRRNETKSDHQNNHRTIVNDFENTESQNGIWYRKTQRARQLEDKNINSFHETKGQLSSNGSTRSSHFSSGSQTDDEEIGATLKPILPRKISEMPRFSPTQAWKSLIVVDQPATPYLSDVSSDDGEVIEEKIWHHQRPVAPRRSAVERCADSGISPDAGSPIPNDGRREPISGRHPGVGRPSTPPSQPMWTPQQDLEDSDVGSTDMSPRKDEICDDVKKDTKWLESTNALLHAKLTLPNGMFPVSKRQELITSALRDKHQKRPSKKKKGDAAGSSSQHFNSLRSLKKVLGGLRIKSSGETARGLDTNWSLSRSNPAIANDNSLEVMGRSPSESALNGKKELERTDSKPLSEGGGYLIYLPEYDSSYNSQVNEITRQGRVVQTKKKNRFSYQNTVRREAKKVTEEKLSVEVAIKERQREKEIQWMNKVEEEFRKRREREKINIRYQLKMLSDEDGTDLGDWVPRDVPEREAVSLPYIPPHSPKQNVGQTSPYRVNENSSTSASSPESMTQWPQTTGMSKWLRRHSSKNASNNNNNAAVRVVPNPTRPEPEGGRSSGDEHKSMEKINQHNYNGKSEEYSSLEGHHRLYSKESEEDYYKESRNSLSNNSKECFNDSRAIYKGNILDESNVPNKLSSNNLILKLSENGCDNKSCESTVVDESVSFSRGHPHRNGGRLKISPTRSNPDQKVDQKQSPPVLHLSPVQPYNPQQVYRPIPFELVLAKNQNGNNGELYVHSQAIRTSVEVR